MRALAFTLSGRGAAEGFGAEQDLLSKQGSFSRLTTDTYFWVTEKVAGTRVLAVDVERRAGSCLKVVFFNWIR